MPTFSSTCVNQLASKPERDETAERIVRALGDANHAQKEEQKERERDRDADEAELLADDGEDEVGVLLRKKAPGASAGR